MKRLLLAALLGLPLLAGCSAPPERVDFEVPYSGDTYRVTREETSSGPGDWLLWRQEGITWRLVASKPASP